MSEPIRHHLPEEILLSYASGAAPEPMALVVATHLALCPSCRAQVAELEGLGGALLEAQEPAPLAVGAIDKAMKALETLTPEKPVLPKERKPGKVPVLPEPLRSRLGADALDLKPRWVFPGVRQVALPMIWGGVPVRLVYLQPGVYNPMHGHHGLEMTLFLQGGLEDKFGTYHRGDVQICHDCDEHDQHVLRDELCICLIVNNARVRPMTWYGKVANWWLGT